MFAAKPTIPYSAILSERWNIGFAYLFDFLLSPAVILRPPAKRVLQPK